MTITPADNLALTITSLAIQSIILSSFIVVLIRKHKSFHDQSVYLLLLILVSSVLLRTAYEFTSLFDFELYSHVTSNIIRFVVIGSLALTGFLIYRSDIITEQLQIKYDELEQEKQTKLERLQSKESELEYLRTVNERLHGISWDHQW